MLFRSARQLLRGPFGAPARPAPFWWLTAAAIGRTLNQFSLPAMLAGTAALSGRGPVWLWLGLSLVKPQIGIVFVAWSVCRGRWRDVAAAFAVPLALTLVYARVAGVPPVDCPRPISRSWWSSRRIWSDAPRCCGTCIA